MKRLLPLVLLLFAASARADWEMFPESRHQLYQSYAFFVEQHCMFVDRGGGNMWATVAANLPVVGNNELSWHPQFVFHLSGNDAMFFDSSGAVYTQTLDTRMGFMFEFTIPDPQLAISIGYFHESGHTVDGTDHPELGPLNLGDNVFRFRVIHDFDKTVRLGFTFDPIEHSIPDNLVSGVDEFIEWFPIGSREAEHKISPFIAVGLLNRIDFEGTITFHAQTGVTWGSHFDEHHTADARFVAGYYSGVDPRSKYAQFLGANSQFGYVGIMFSL